MRAPVEAMIKSKQWRSVESMATTKLNHLDHLFHRVICIPVCSKVQVPEDRNEEKRKHCMTERVSFRGTRPGCHGVPGAAGPIASWTGWTIRN